MKTKNFFKLMMVYIVPVLFSCNKDQSTEQPSKDQTAMTKADYAVMNRIVTFRQKLAYKKAHPHFKSGEIVPVDSARWDVETNFNASYAFPDERYLATSRDSSVLFLTVINDSTTLMDDVLAFNDQCLDEVLTIYSGSPYANKELLFVSLRKGEIVLGEMEVKLEVVMGEKLGVPYNFTPFAVGDDWKYGDYLGKCNGSNAGTDAAEQLELLLNNNKTTYCHDMPGPPTLYRKIYTNDPMSPYELQGFEYENANGEYLMYYISKNTSLTAEELCLDYNEMNFHYNGEWEVIYDRIRIDSNRSCNWDFMLCELSGLRETGYQGTTFNDKARHQNYLYYSYHHWVKRDYIEDPMSLGTIIE